MIKIYQGCPKEPDWIILFLEDCHQKGPENGVSPVSLLFAASLSLMNISKDSLNFLRGPLEPLRNQMCNQKQGGGSTFSSSLGVFHLGCIARACGGGLMGTTA